TSPSTRASSRTRAGSTARRRRKCCCGAIPSSSAPRRRSRSPITSSARSWRKATPCCGRWARSLPSRGRSLTEFASARLVLTLSPKIRTFPLPSIEGAVTPLDEPVGQDIDDHLGAVLLDHIDHERAQFVSLGDHVHVEHKARHIRGSCDCSASPCLLELRKERQHIVGKVA